VTGDSTTIVMQDRGLKSSFFQAHEVLLHWQCCAVVPQQLLLHAAVGACS